MICQALIPCGDGTLARCRQDGQESWVLRRGGLEIVIELCAAHNELMEIEEGERNVAGEA